MADLPSGAAFGSLVHGVLEESDPEAPDQEQFLIWCLGSILFSHAATMISVSYFDQSVFFLYLVLAAIGSLRIGPRNTALVDELQTT